MYGPGYPGSNRTGYMQHSPPSGGGGGSRKGRAAKRDFKDRLERACQRHGTTLERARVPVRGCRKVTYVLDWGRVTGMHNFQNEKGAVKLVPGGFKVVFEASNYVWIAEVQFSTPGVQATDVPMFQVYPVRQDGTMQPPGSGWLDNISAAFRRALGVLNGDLQKEQHRPNGRLYLGIFYPAVQTALMDVLRQDTNRVDPAMRDSVHVWLEGGDAASIASASSRASNMNLATRVHTPTASAIAEVASAPNAVAGKDHVMPSALTHPHGLARNSPALGHNNANNTAANGGSMNTKPGALSGHHAQKGSAHLGGSTAGNISTANAASLDDFGWGHAPRASLHGQQQHQQHRHQNLPHRGQTHTPDSAGMKTEHLHTHSMASQIAQRVLQSKGHARAPPAPPASASSMSSSSAASSAAGSMPPPRPMDIRNRALGVPGAGMVAQQTVEESRKRAMADGGHKLLHLATSGQMMSRTGGLENIEEILQTVLSQIKSNDISGGETAAALMRDMDDSDPEATRRVLGMLKEIKRELVVRSAAKRRRILTDDGSDISASSVGSVSKRHSSAGNLSDFDYTAPSAAQHHHGQSGATAAGSALFSGKVGPHQTSSVHPPLHPSGTQGASSSSSGHAGPPGFGKGKSNLYGLSRLRTNSADSHGHPLRGGLALDDFASHHTGPDAGAGGFTNGGGGGGGGLFGSSSSVASGPKSFKGGAASHSGHSVDDHFVGFDTHSIGGFSDPGGALGTLFLDLEDYDTDEAKKMPIIVGCHLSHEGLFLRLAPPNTDGFSEEELANAMTSLRIPAASSIVRATLQAADVNNNGRVSMPEFLNFLKRREEELKLMFDSIDRDKDGVISLRDLKWARDEGKLEQTASDEELQALLEWMDTLEDAYQDHRIHFEEFRTGLILLPPATTLTDLIRHFREQGIPEAKYTATESIGARQPNHQQRQQFLAP